MRHFDDLLPIVSKPEVMRFIMNGKTWTPDKLKEKLEMSDADWRGQVAPAHRGYFWAVRDGGRAVGLVGFFRRHENGPFEFRVFLDNTLQRRGLGSRATREALRRFAELVPATPVEGAAHADNPGGAALMRKVGFTDAGPGTIGRHQVQKFLCASPALAGKRPRSQAAGGSDQDPAEPPTKLRRLNSDDQQ